MEDLSWIAFDNDPKYKHLSPEDKRRLYRLKVDEIFQTRYQVGLMMVAGHSGGGGGTSQPPPAPLDPDAIVFLNAAGIPNDETVFFANTVYEKAGAEISEIVNDLVLDLKGAGSTNSTVNFWTGKNLLVFHPFVGGTASSHKYNLKSPFTYEITFAPGWTHSATGALPNGNTFAGFGLSPSSLNGNNVSFGRYNGTGGNSSSVDMGVANAGNNEVWAVFSSYANLAYFVVSGYSLNIPDTLGLGLYFVNRPGGNVTEGYRNGELAASGSDVAVTLTDEFYYGALNQGGTAAFKDDKEIRTGFVMDSLTESEASIFYNVVQEFHIRLNRSVDTRNAYFFGDSTTAGAGASAPGNKWSSLISFARGWAEVNNGVSGTTMESASPVDAIGAPNMYDNRGNIPTYSASQDAALFFSYSINDCGLNLPTYSVFLYGMQFGEVLDTAIAKGWPLERIIVMVGLRCAEANWNDYLGFGAGVSVAATNARHEAFIAEAGAVATAKGVKWINPYQAMIDSGVDPPDGRHPNDFLHALIADYVLDRVSDI